VLDREGAATGTDADQAASAQRYVSLQAEVIRRVEADPRISSVVIASVVPGDEPKVSIEAERTVSAASTDTAVGRAAAGYAVRVARVEPDFFDVLDIPIVAGRGFATGDVSSAANAVIVNRSFVEEVLGGGDPLGRRVHRAAKLDARGAEGAPAEPWYEIVGVVPDYPRRFDPNTPEPRLYQPLGIASAANVIRPGRQRTVAGKIRQELPGQPDAIAGDARAPVLVVRVRGVAPAAFADRLREITVSVDPMLRLAGVAPLAETLRRMMDINRFIAFGVAGLTLSVILLSAAGIYALMSFTITRRRREIGIRSALGAGARSVLWSVLSRAMGQIAIGIGVGIGLMALIDRATRGEMLGGSAALLLPAVAALMALVGLAAAVGPARRALRIQPTEALRADG
jgi:hypothetical protein